MNKCGLRKAYADGGSIGRAAWEANTLKSLDDRMGWGKTAASGTNAMDTLGTKNFIEDSNNAVQFDALRAKADDINSIGGTGLSQRQKAAALGQLGDSAAKMGMSLDTGAGDLRGLSARQKLGVDMGALGQQAAIGNFDAARQKSTLDAGYQDARAKMLGFKQGGTVDAEGFIHGEKGVDKVPAKVAETGEDILVSHGERIVNKKQNAALEKLAAAAGMGLDEYLEKSTGEPVGPTLKQGLRGLNRGGFVDDFGNLQEPVKFQSGANRTVLHQQIANAAADAQAAPTGQTVSRIPSQSTQAAPTPAAAPPTQAQPATRMGRFVNGLKSAIRSPLTLAPALLQGGAMAIDAIDSIPSLRGQHTATSTDMSIPESDRAVLDQKDLEARDAAWSVRHNKSSLSQPKQPVAQLNPGDKGYNENFDSTDRRSAQERQATGATNELEAKGLRNAQQFLGGEGAAIPTGLRTARQIESNAPLTTWNSKEDVAATSLRNKVMPENGTGIMSVRQKDGSFKNVAIGQSEYVGADGKPTNDWSKTQQYADGVARAQREKAQLDQIQRERANFDAFDAGITDPNARASGLRRVMMYAASDEAGRQAAIANSKNRLELAKFDQEERKMKNLQGNSDREFAQKNYDNNVKDMNEWLETMAPTAGLKDAELGAAQRKRAMLQQSLKNHWGGDLPADRQTYMKEQPRMAREAAATARMYDVLSNQGFIDRHWRNSQNPALTLQAMRPSSYKEDDDLLTLADGYKIKGKEIWGQDADVREAILGRIKK